MSKFYVYKLTNTTDGKLYVGKTNNLERRWNAHRTHPFSDDERTRNECPKLYEAIRQHGIAKFKFDVIETYATEMAMCQAEIKYVVELNTVEDGLNATIPGIILNCGRPCSSETRKKLSVAHKGKHAGEKNPMYGKPVSQERRDKVALANAKYTIETIIAVKKALHSGSEIRDIGQLYEIPIATVYGILQCKRWENIAPELNDELLKRHQKWKRLTKEQTYEILDAWDSGKYSTINDLYQALRNKIQKDVSTFYNVIKRRLPQS